MRTSEDPSAIFSTFEQLTADSPAAPVMISGDDASIVTRAQLLSRSDAIAEILKGQGLRRGDLLAVQLPNSPDFVASFLASLRLGTSFVPIDRDARESEASTVLSAFSVRAFLTRPAADSLPCVSIRENETVVGASAHPLIKLTSGSAGLPRGVLTSEKNLLADCSNICRSMQITADDLNLGAIPFSHSYGFSNLVMPLLTEGTTLVWSNNYLPLSLLELSNRFRCTVVPGIPMMYEHLAQLSHDDGRFETVKTFISAGAPLSAEASLRFRERFGQSIHTFYGCSETGGISYDLEGDAVERGNAGTALTGVSLSLTTDGRLRVQSDAVARGYLSATAIDETNFPLPGAFITDDLVRLNSGGELQLHGRLGDLINTAGKKVNPREVEQVILQIAGVREVRVYGEEAGARGSVVAAVVVAGPGVTREQIRAWCGVRLSSHKVPRIIKLADSIPLDGRGKIKRSALADL